MSAGDNRSLTPDTPAIPRRGLSFFSLLHAKVFLWFYGCFALLTLLALLPGSLSGHGDTLGRSLLAAVGSFSGPFTGAIARGLQPCCLAFSMRLLPICAAFLVGGFIFQMVPLPSGRMERRVHMVVWCLGLLGWFSGIPLSFLHALS